jgi:ABC-2 type transport system permease protein
MIAAIKRRARVYWAFVAMMPKLYMAYSIWVWMQWIVQIIALVILVSFWSAVYGGNTASVGGLEKDQTLNYIILAQIFLPVVHAPQTIGYIGSLMRDGQIGIELLRPVDFQLANYIRNLGEVGVGLFVQIPLVVIGWLLYHFQLPTNLSTWLAFVITLLLGNAVVFFFDWCLACIAFYSTEVWGIMVMRYSLATFFSGSLIPMVMMPDWLQNIMAALPFSYSLYMPVSILSGITPVSEMPRIWGFLVAYLITLILFSRLMFKVASRKVTVQGG